MCVCVCAQYVCICVIKRDSVLYRGINYCVIGLSQPRYVTLNLVAKRKGGEKTTNYCEMYNISASMSTSHSNRTCALTHRKTERERKL